MLNDRDQDTGFHILLADSIPEEATVKATPVIGKAKIGALTAVVAFGVYIFITRRPHDTLKRFFL